MKLVIDISEDDYEIIKYCGCLPEPFEIFRIAIQNGTPLEEELEKIKAEAEELIEHCDTDYEFEEIYGIKLVVNIINRRIAELKGENNGTNN